MYFGVLTTDPCSGASTSLPQLVLARVLAGLSGSGMVSLVSMIIMGMYTKMIGLGW